MIATKITNTQFLLDSVFQWIDLAKMRRNDYKHSDPKSVKQ